MGSIVIVAFFACAILGVFTLAAWACDLLGDRRDDLEVERRRQDAIRRCVLRARRQQAP